MKHNAIQRYNYHTWANNQVFDHLGKNPELYDRQVKSVFPSISEVIAHIYQVDGMWLSVMSGDTFEQTKKVIVDIQKELSDKRLENMEELYSKLTGRYDAFLTGQEDLDSMLDIAHPHLGSLTVAISDLLEHVVNHGTYHRGNITAMLRQQGQAGVPTDYVFFLQRRSAKD